MHKKNSSSDDGYDGSLEGALDNELDVEGAL